MQISSKSLPKSRIALTVEFTPEEWGKYRNQALRKLAKQISIPGFRKGHVPEKVVLEQISEGAIIAETIDLALPQSYMEAVRQENIAPLASPEVKILSEEPFRYEAIIPVIPEIKIHPLKKLKGKKEPIEVTEKEIDTMIEEFRRQLSEQKPVERAAKNGDVAVIDFAGFDMDDVPLEGTQSTAHPVEIGSKTMIPGFEEELIGLTKDQQKSFQLTFPKDYHSAKFAGKKVRFEITAQEIREVVLPEVNEEFVEKLTGEKKEVAALRTEIADALKQKKTAAQKQEHEAALLEELEKAVSVELPEVLITEEVEFLLDNLKMQGLQYGMTWERKLLQLKKSEEEIRKELFPQAEKQVRTRLGIQKFLEEDKITVTPEEIATEIEKVLNRLQPKQRDKEAAQFLPGQRGWQEAEHRAKVQKWVEQKLVELTT